MCSVRHARARGERVFPRGVSPLMNDRAPPINGVERGSGSSRGGKAPYKRRARNLIARLFELASTRKTGQPCGLRSIANGAKDRPTQALPEEHARQATTLEESQTTRGADTMQIFSKAGGGALFYCALFYPELDRAEKTLDTISPRQSRKEGGAKRDERSGSRRRQVGERYGHSL